MSPYDDPFSKRRSGLISTLLTRSTCVKKAGISDYLQLQDDAQDGSLVFVNLIVAIIRIKTYSQHRTESTPAIIRNVFAKRIASA